MEVGGGRASRFCRHVVPDRQTRVKQKNKGLRRGLELNVDGNTKLEDKKSVGDLATEGS